EAHVNMIAKPEGQRDVPAIPEITDVSCEERPAEVFRSVNAKEITNADGKGAVAGKIEKEKETVGIHITEQRNEAFAARSRVEPALFDQGCQYEFVKQPAKKEVHGAIKVSQELGARSFLSPVGFETPIAVNRAGRNRGEK